MDPFFGRERRDDFELFGVEGFRQGYLDDEVGDFVGEVDGAFGGVEHVEGLFHDEGLLVVGVLLEE